MAGACLVVLTSCLPQLVPTYDPSSTATQRTAILTPDGSDAYAFVVGGGTLDAQGLGGNAGHNLRYAFWPSGVPVLADSQSCALWTSQDGGYAQQGAAFRIRRSSDGRMRAVTVTKNVVFGVNWGFNFHTWDTDRDIAFQQFGGKVIPGLKGANGYAVPLPWHFCARAIGPTIEFKVWTTHMAEPAWGDPDWSGHAHIPDGFSAAGTTGWFAGHLQAGERMRFDDLRTWRYSTTPPPIPTTTSTRPTPIRPPLVLVPPTTTTAPTTAAAPTSSSTTVAPASPASPTRAVAGFGPNP